MSSPKEPNELPQQAESLEIEPMDIPPQDEVAGVVKAGAFLDVVSELASNPAGEEADLQERPSEPPSEPHGDPEQEQEEDDEGEVLELSQTPTSRFDNRNRLVVKKKYLGYGKNSEGVVGLCGQLTISWFHTAALAGRIESTNPLLFLSKRVLSGEKTVVTYWMPPVAFPNPTGHLTIKTGRERKVLSLRSLFPESRTELLRDHQAGGLLLLPSFLGFAYFLTVYLISMTGLKSTVWSLFPEQAEAALSGAPVSFRAQGLGIYQLEVVPTAESLQLIWAVMIFVAGILTCRIFRHLAPYRQRRFGGLLALGLLLPTMGLLLLWNLQSKVFPLIYHPDFAPLELGGLLNWAAPMQAGLALYLYLSGYRAWERLLPAREFRFLLPGLLTLGYVLGAGWLIFGRSWLG